MTGREHRSNRYIGAASAALLLSLSFTTATASNDVKPSCDEITDKAQTAELPADSLRLRLTDHGLTDSSADMKSPAADPAGEKVSSPTLSADSNDSGLQDNAASSTTEAESAAAADDLPETALRLPGVSDKELPRFRRQMYRTDI